MGPTGSAGPTGPMSPRRGDGAREVGSASAPVEKTSDVSMGNARSEDAWGKDAGEVEGGAEPADKGATAVVIGAGWTEVAGPSIKEKPEDL